MTGSLGGWCAVAGDMIHERRVVYDRARARRLIHLLVRCSSFTAAVQASLLEEESDDPYCPTCGRPEDFCRC